MGALTIASLADLCGGSLKGDGERSISGANTVEEAGPDELAFVANRKAEKAAGVSRAGCLIVSSDFAAVGDWALIRVADPRAAFARALETLYPSAKIDPFIHSTAIIAPSARLAGDCYIGPYVTVGDNCRIGAGTRVSQGCHIGRDVDIGDSVFLHPNVTLYERVRIGNRVLLHAGCVIGADGFGFVLQGDRYVKFPQVGTVEIGDDVEIGANSCVDLATLRINKKRSGTKLDNLVHIGHNCDVGHSVVIAAQTGLAGGVTVGDFAVLGGQVGVADKARIAARAIVGAKSGIVSSQRVEAGEPVWGIPARPIKRHLRGLASINKLPELREEVRELKARIEEAFHSSDRTQRRLDPE